MAQDRLETGDLGWRWGSPDAPIQVVEFTDPACPYCAQFHAEARDSLVRDFVAPGHAYWITIPWVSGLYPNSEIVARALECMGEREAFETLLGALYEKRRAWVGAGRGAVRRVLLEEGEAAGVAPGRLGDCLDRPETRTRVEAARALGVASAVRGTPTYFINGFQAMGAVPYAFIKRVFDRELTRSPG